MWKVNKVSVAENKENLGWKNEIMTEQLGKLMHFYNTKQKNITETQTTIFNFL